MNFLGDRQVVIFQGMFGWYHDDSLFAGHCGTGVR
jgi:hypothetical protein